MTLAPFLCQVETYSNLQNEVHINGLDVAQVWEDRQAGVENPPGKADNAQVQSVL